MNVIGFSGLANSIPFKRKHFPGLSEREYNIAQGLDAAAALVNPGGIVAAAAEERFTRQKATGAFPVSAISYCLQEANLSPADIDFIGHGKRARNGSSAVHKLSPQFDRSHQKRSLGILDLQAVRQRQWQFRFGELER